MSLHKYIEKLRAKPVHERRRIAIGVTIVGFFLFVAIWVVSLKEMNKSVEPQADQTSASLDDLKNNFQDNLQTGKDSIQNMMQQLPSETSPAGDAGATPTDPAGNVPLTPNDNLPSSMENVPNSDSLQNTNINPPTNSSSPDQKNDNVP